MTKSSIQLSATITALHVRFLKLLPRLETHARIIFRTIACAQKRADQIAEAIALSWKWFLRLYERGKRIEDFPTTFASLVVRAVKTGRKLVGQDKSKDVLNPLTQRRRNFAVQKLPDYSTLSDNPVTEALADNTSTPPGEAAAFRIDFPCWVATRTERDRCVIDDFILGEKPLAVSRKYRISPGRVSQLRANFHADWHHFCADPLERQQPTLV